MPGGPPEGAIASRDPIAARRPASTSTSWGGAALRALTSWPSSSSSSNSNSNSSNSGAGASGSGGATGSAASSAAAAGGQRTSADGGGGGQVAFGHQGWAQPGEFDETFTTGLLQVRGEGLGEGLQAPCDLHPCAREGVVFQLHTGKGCPARSHAALLSRLARGAQELNSMEAAAAAAASGVPGSAGSLIGGGAAGDRKHAELKRAFEMLQVGEGRARCGHGIAAFVASRRRRLAPQRPCSSRLLPSPLPLRAARSLRLLPALSLS